MYTEEGGAHTRTVEERERAHMGVVMYMELSNT